jgi:hypothetical protein
LNPGPRPSDFSETPKYTKVIVRVRIDSSSLSVVTIIHNLRQDQSQVTKCRKIMHYLARNACSRSSGPPRPFRAPSVNGFPNQSSYILES